MPKKRIKRLGEVDLQKCNKFDFEEGKEFEFDDLPKKIKKDVGTMFLDDFYHAPEEYIYRCVLLTPEEMWEIIGEDAFNNIDQFELDRSERKIKREGLDYPCVQSNYKMMIYTTMEEKLPFLDMILKPKFEEI
jgi:hypothetical protein